MSIELREIFDAEQKSVICNHILRALPNWFGVEASIVEYTEQVKTMPFWAAFEKGKAIGFVALKNHNAYTAEVPVMGVLTEFHRQGIGKKLIQLCEEYCKTNRKEFLTVKTLDESRASKSYERTRLFYLGMGFKPLEVFPLYWDADNPCLFLIKCLHSTTQPSLS